MPNVRYAFSCRQEAGVCYPRRASNSRLIDVSTYGLVDVSTARLLLEGRATAPYVGSSVFGVSWSYFPAQTARSWRVVSFSG